MKSIRLFIDGMEPRVGAAVIAFIGVVISIIISAIISLIVSRRSSYIVAVTAERSKWIDKLRKNIADLLGTCGAINTLNNRSSDAARDRREKVNRLIALITMQLNPRNPIDSNMIGLLRRFVSCVEKQAKVEDDEAKTETTAPDYRCVEKAFVRHAQFLLKEEWEKVKFEAMGCLSKPLWYWKHSKRKKDYKQFCKQPEAHLDEVQLAKGKTAVTTEPPPSEQPLPAGYRQGLISAITVLLGFSLLFLRFVVFEPASGPWTRLGALSAFLVSLSVIVQLFALWRALQIADDKVRIYTVTVRWFVAGILILGASLAVDAVASIIYGQWA